MNGTAQRSTTAHLTLVATPVPTPSAAELERLVALEAPPQGPSLRLTRRGRLVVVALFLGVLFGGGVLFGTGVSKAGASDAAGPAHQYVVVQPGQTLWGIAKQIAPHDDPRATIEAIRRLNSLPDTGVQAGQRIALP
jgi:hypothetical protein